MRAARGNGAGEALSSPAQVRPEARTMTKGSGELQGIVPVNAVKKGAPGHRRWQTMNRPQGQFIWFERELLESPAWAAMTLPARRVVERVVIEHMKHGGTRNGALIVTYDDFERFGLRRKSVPDAIRIAVALGFLDVTSRGRRSHGIARRASTYGITWLPRCDCTPASNRWRRINDAAEAKRLIEGS
jgi:hypothetical protein